MLLGSKHATAFPDSFFLLDLRLSSSPSGLHGGLFWESRNPGIPGAPTGAGGQERTGEEAAAWGIRRRQTSGGHAVGGGGSGLADLEEERPLPLCYYTSALKQVSTLLSLPSSL